MQNWTLCHCPHFFFPVEHKRRKLKKQNKKKNYQLFDPTDFHCMDKQTNKQ